MRSARSNEQLDNFTNLEGPRSGRGRRGSARAGGGRGRGRGGRSGTGGDTFGHDDVGRDGRGRPGPGRRRGGRARRGDVRAAVVALLAERPMHGYEIIQELDERTGGAWRPSPGSVYPTLSLLEDEGLVTATEEDGKRRFTLTEAGQEANDARTGGRAPWDEVTDGVSTADLALRKLLGQLGLAVKQVAMTDDDTAKTQAVEVLTDTRKRLYAILAETD